MNENARVEPTLLSAAWRFRWLVLIVTALAVALGFVYLEVNPPQILYGSQASMVVQATGGGLDLGASGSDQRFVANQVEILQSGLVAQLASDIATESGANLSAQDLAGDRKEHQGKCKADHGRAVRIRCGERQEQGH